MLNIRDVAVGKHVCDEELKKQKKGNEIYLTYIINT